MFEEFRACAVADATGKMVSTTGLENLIAYYETVLQGEQEKPLGNIEFLYGQAIELAAKADIS
ncbi:hypothetical protein CH063_09848 [Colletotrichum higginsianum]|uniref:La domain family protein n=2 Tax=Colletotrichum destructivum species complex TaxID=2707350 RepID=H1VF56_COLHI|nr:La domain family protein [Colletotrichum higginsianum IMI 349063]OBR05135.1 La domain family protein [Colletotrichum higginsianum IMI 349063]GJC99766.1 LA domain family protein [Colletotrichum higginsianum]CCF38859.1 hypothetical protein CH063_09848 [Colletotrichum higginsianum]